MLNYAKKAVRDLGLIAYAFINSKQFRDVNVRPETVKTPRRKSRGKAL